MHDIFDLKGYIDKLITTINETCDNARNALNILMGISVVMGGLILGVDDEILFLDQGAIVPYAGIPITVSTVFAIFPVVYLVIYGLLCLKLSSIIKLTKEFITTRDRLIDKTQSELLYPLTQQDDRLLKNASNVYNNQLKSFFFLDSLLHKNKLAIIISYILLFCVPLAVLIKAMLVFLPYQSWVISISHWIVILGLLYISFKYIFYIFEKNNYYTILLIIIMFLTGILLLSIPLFVVFLINNIKEPIDVREFHVNDFLNQYYGGLYKKNRLDLSNKTLVKKPTSDGILAVAYKKDLQDKDKTHFKQAQWKYAEGYFLRNRSFKGIDLSYATAFKIDLQDSDLRYANLTEANLTSADLRYADLRYADLIIADLRYADLTSADLTSADLTSADLTNADLTNADLTNSNLTSAILFYANLTSADLTGATLIGADLQKSNLKSANLEEAIYNSKIFIELEKTNFGNEKIDKSTILDICSDIITNEFFNLKYEGYTKRKKVGNGYNYSAYCSDE